VIFQMCFVSLFAVARGMVLVGTGQLRMVRSCLVSAGIVMLAGFLMVPCRVLVMFCCLLMMLCCLF
jgi:hypothetical protein